MNVLWRLSDWLRHRARLRRDNPDHAWGARGEDLAHRFLQKLGYRVVARNWRAEDGSGELDLVAWDGPELVVVEVKARASAAFGLPEEAVDAAKRDNLRRTAARYVREADLAYDCLRFDIVSILLGSERPRIEHLKGAFSRPL
ncbi:MAG TPA: YraN family protein [Bryobacteraceae bacterium]|nr:YraN family protein [Bryobacteraceae bacterium]